MGPPHKRRKLSSWTPQVSAVQEDAFSPHLTPTSTHPAAELSSTTSTTSATRTVPHRVEEIHLRIQERAVIVRPHDDEDALQRRQTVVQSVISTIDAQGNPTTWTAGIGAGAATSYTALLASVSTSLMSSHSGSPVGRYNSTSTIGSSEATTATSQTTSGMYPSFS